MSAKYFLWLVLMEKQDKHHNSYLICNGRLITPFETITPGWILVDNGKIKKIGKGNKPVNNCVKRQNIKKIDAKGNFVVPGLIDTHVCGMLGYDCREGRKAYTAIANGLARFGITGFLPTIVSSQTTDILELLSEAKQAQAIDEEASEILGVHLEGPYLGRKYRGLTLKKELAEPSIRRDTILYERFPHFIKLVTLAPELPGCLEYIRYLKKLGIVVSIGHTEINSNSDLDKAVEAGASHVTHIFNAMHIRHLKEPGVYSPSFDDLALLDDRLSVSLIADGVHVCPELINLLMRAKPHEKTILITDCFMGTAMPNGIYVYPDDVKVVVDGTCHRTVKGQLLAGSILTLNRAIKNIIDWTSLPVSEILPMATYNPAKLLGLHNKKGALKTGMDADIVIFDREWNVQHTFLAGRIIYQSC